MELEPTLLLVGAVKAAANAGAAEIGKKTGSVVAERTKGLLVRMHMARRGYAAGAVPGEGEGTGFGESAAAGGTADLERVELDPARAEEYAVAIMRRAAVDPETAREVADLLAMAREAGDIPRLPVMPPVIAPPRVFVNRVAEQADLTDAAAAGVIVVAGRPGIGKTALVGKWLADLVAAKAFEVCVYLELPDRGRDAGVGDVARELLRRVGADTSVPRSDAEWVALWHSVMRGKRYCVVVDEVTQPGQVRALIPESGAGLPSGGGAPGGAGAAGGEGLPSGGSLLVAVGAEPLAELAGQGAEFVEVGPFDADAGVALMRRLIGDARVDAEPEAVDEVVEACDGIPAVLALAAGILGQKRDWPVAQLATLLADGERQLDVLRKRGGGRHVVDLVFDAGYAELDADAAQAYRAMGHLERADFQPGVLAALADLPEPATAAALETLLAKYMVTEHEWPSTGYRVGDMQRNHAREAAQRAGEFGVQARTAALRRVRDMLVATVQEADVAASPDQPLRVPEVAAGGGRFATGAEGLQWVDAHLPDLLACVESGDDAALRIAGSVWPYVTNYRRWDDGVWLYRHAADVARRTGFAEAEARNLCELSRCLLETYDKVGARAAVTRAARIVGEAPARLRASVTEFVGLVELADGEHEKAYELFVECGRLHRGEGEDVTRGEVLAMEMQGRALRWGGEFERAVTVLEQALEQALVVAPDGQRLQARLRMDLAEALLNANRGGEAVRYLEEALPLLEAQRMAGDKYNAEVMLRAARRAG